MLSIHELRKFLVSERFVIHKGDYVGHEFHGNQYTEANASQHVNMSNNAGELVTTLKREGRQQRGRSHGYSLDGDIAKAAMDAIDHKVAAIKKSSSLKEELNALEKKIVAAGAKTNDWAGNYPKAAGSLRQMLYEYQGKKRDLEQIESPSISSGWMSRNSHTLQSLSKDAVSALNRGYKELISTMPVPPKAKTLFDKNNQPRPEALATIVANVKKINSDYRAAVKTAQDENADPIERFKAANEWQARASNAKIANNFLKQVYRMANDGPNELAAEKMRSKSELGIDEAISYHKANIGVIVPKTVEAYFDKANALVNPATYDPSAPNATENAKQAAQEARKAYDAAIASYSKLPYGPARDALQNLMNQTKARTEVYAAVSKDASSYRARQEFQKVAGDIGKGSFDKDVVENGVNQGPENYRTAEKVYEAYRVALVNSVDAREDWDKAVKSLTSTGLDASVGKAKADNAKSIEKSVSDFGPKIGDSYLTAGRQMMDYIRTNANSTDPKVVDKANSFLSYVGRCSQVGKSVFGTTGSVYSGRFTPISGFEDKFNESVKLGTESSVFSDLIVGKSKALSAIEDAKTLPEVDTKDINRSDPSSYMYKSTQVMSALREAKAYFDSARNAVRNSNLPDADKKDISDSIDKTAGDAEKTLTELTDGVSQKVLESAIKNGDAAAEAAQKGDCDNPMYEWHNAYEQYKLANDSLNGRVSTLRVDYSKLGPLRAEVQRKMDEASKRNNAYRRERQYAL